MNTASVANNLLSSATATSASVSQTSSSTSGTIAGNFQTFLTLLTTQLQNQNPLDPLDTNQFTQQLVQFAGVEQQLKSNEQLTTLIAYQQAGQASQALNFVGKTVSVDGSAATLDSGGTATWNVSTATNAKVTVTITSSTGQTAFTRTFNSTAGVNQVMNWAGEGNDGTKWPPGSYTMTVSAKDAAGNPVAANTEVYGKVQSVDLTQSPPLLLINGRNYTMYQVKSIVADKTTTPSTSPTTETPPQLPPQEIPAVTSVIRAISRTIGLQQGA